MMNRLPEMKILKNIRRKNSPEKILPGLRILKRLNLKMKTAMLPDQMITATILRRMIMQTHP